MDNINPHTGEIREQALCLLLEQTLSDSSLTEQEALALLYAYALATTDDLLAVLNTKTNEKEG